MKRHLVEGSNLKKKQGFFEHFNIRNGPCCLVRVLNNKIFLTTAFLLYQNESRIKIVDVGQPNVLVTLSCVAVQKRCSSITNCMLSTVLRLQKSYSRKCTLQNCIGKFKE